MKKLILIIIAFMGFAFGADAQINNDKLILSGDTFYMNGLPLNDGELSKVIGADLYNEEYLPAKRKLRTSDTMGYIGATLVGSGIGLLAGQGISDLAYGNEFRARPYIVYGCVAAVGIIPSILYFTLDKKGKEAYTRIAETYNGKTGEIRELTLSPAKNGFGIALNF